MAMDYPTNLGNLGQGQQAGQGQNFLGLNQGSKNFAQNAFAAITRQQWMTTCRTTSRSKTG